MPRKGFLPCFSEYKFKKYPIDDIYLKTSDIRRVKYLVSALIDSKSTQDIKENIGGHDIKPIRPDSQEGKWLIKLCGFGFSIFRIDYKNCKFRVIFGLSNKEGLAYIFAFDTKHSTFGGKRRG